MKVSKLAHAVRDIFRWRWNVRGVTGPAAADPILAFSELPRLWVTAAPLRQKHLVNFADETKGERKAVPYAFQTMIQGRHIVGDFLHVVQRNARRFCILIKLEVEERRLRSFDLRREHGLLTNVGVKEELEVRERGGRPIQPADGLVRFRKDGLKRCQIECPLIWRQRRGKERADSLTGKS
jgi:hypothetical protein